MKVEKMVMAGSLESNDLLITLSQSEDKTLNLNIESIVKKQFGKRIKTIVKEMLEEFNVQEGNIRIQDMGALDCTIKARMETAILRIKEENND